MLGNPVSGDLPMPQTLASLQYARTLVRRRLHDLQARGLDGSYDRLVLEELERLEEWLAIHLMEGQ